jgi:hypothetical protein
MASRFMVSSLVPDPQSGFHAAIPTANAEITSQRKRIKKAKFTERLHGNRVGKVKKATWPNLCPATMLPRGTESYPLGISEGLS